LKYQNYGATGRGKGSERWTERRGIQSEGKKKWGKGKHS